MSAMSSKIIILRFLAVFALFLMLIPSGLALSEEFNAFATNEVVNVCSCSLTSNLVKVENTGDITSVFNIEKQGESAKWATFSDDSFTLEPGKSQLIETFVNVPCDVRGEYDLTTTISTTFGLKKDIFQTVKVDNCLNINLITNNYMQSACPCNPVRYDFEIQNTGDFLEIYSISVAPYQEYVEIGEPLLIVEPGKSQKFTVFINMPCAMHGKFDFKLTALAENSKMQAEVPFGLEIDKCYEYEVSMADRYSICKKTIDVVPVEIKNVAEVYNSYTLELKNPSWGYFENNNIFLLPGETGTLNVVFNPANIQQGEYEAEILATSERGGLEKTRASILSVENCYDIGLSIPEEDLVAVAGEKVDYNLVIRTSVQNQELQTCSLSPHTG
jgi:uncharacterized membrane protein